MRKWAGFPGLTYEPDLFDDGDGQLETHEMRSKYYHSRDDADSVGNGY